MNSPIEGRGRYQKSRELVIAAVVTPFDDGGVDLDSFEENLRFQDAAGLDGVLVAGTTGECECLSPEERDALLQRAREVLDPELLIITGLRPATPSASANAADACRAADLGADLILAAPPEGPDPAPNIESCLAWYTELVEKSSKPVLAYHSPPWRDRPMTASLRQRLRDLEGLAGVKDSLGRSDLIKAWRPGPGFSVFVGNALTWLEGTPGVAGGILALASAYPESFVSAAEARADQDRVRMTELRSELSLPLKRFSEGGLFALKEMHEERALFGGAMRRKH